MTDTWAFAFVDLAGFTALTDAHGDQAAADHVAELCRLAEAALSGSTRLVKSIGDAVMLAADDVEDGLDSCLALLTACAGLAWFPLARAGLHVGTAVQVGDDFVGAGVNVAARVAGHASGGQLLLTAIPAQAARARGLHLHELGRLELKNLSEPLEVFGVDVVPGPQVVDPVCRMTVRTEAAAGVLQHGGHDYWFCSLECAQAFAGNPQRYT